MNDNTHIKSTLARLHAELDQADPADDDLRRLLVDVDNEIHELLEQNAEEDVEVGGLTERLEALAADFAARHPTTERFFQELVNALGRMGI
jgi:ABC-type transporter Mla subunit MlaD